MDNKENELYSKCLNCGVAFELNAVNNDDERISLSTKGIKCILCNGETVVISEEEYRTDYGE